MYQSERAVPIEEARRSLRRPRRSMRKTRENIVESDFTRANMPRREVG